MIPALALIALVTQDRASLRGDARDSAVRHATLWQGDVLEVRGESKGFFKVSDHRRERQGYVRAWQVRAYPLSPEAAPEILAVVRFLRDTPGSEALGIAHAALFLRVAEPAAIGAEVFDALGTMADRLARRASTRFGKAGDEVEAAHAEVAASYGVKLVSFDKVGRVVVCYDGDAFRRVLALGGTPEQRLRAALGLTRPECAAAGSESERIELDRWRAEVLDSADPGKLLPHFAQRLRIRRAGVWASLAFDEVRIGDAAQSHAAGARAIEELARIDRHGMAEDDERAYLEAGVRVGASRWAADDDAVTDRRLGVSIGPGTKPGESCLRVIGDGHGVGDPLFLRCTFAIVWAASARVSPKGDAVALAVQPLEGWRELWIFHRTKEGWTVDAITPASDEAEIGYVELAGWSPDGKKLLTAGESKKNGAFVPSFEIRDLTTLLVERRAGSPDALTPFHRWQSAEWRTKTLALR